MCAVQAVNVVLPDKINAVSYVLTLTIENVCQVECEESLISAHYEQIWVALRMDAKQRANSVGIFGVEVNATLADDLIVDTGLLHLKTRCINQHIDFILHPIELWSAFVNLSYPLAFGVDESDIWPIKGG